MNLKKLIVFLVLSLFCIPTGFVFAEDNNLEIEEGKSLLFDFKGLNEWYTDSEVYDNVNIGAGTKVVLNSQWEYTYKGSTVTTVTPSTSTQQNSGESGAAQEPTERTFYEYAKEENLATLSIKNDGELILNSGSELVLRNEYNLITSVNNVSLRYEQSEADDTIIKRVGESFNNNALVGYEGEDRFYYNRDAETPVGRSDLFTGKIVFENGDADTKLTFVGASNKTSEKYILPKASTSTETIGVQEIETAMVDNKNNKVHLYNDFEINSNRAVFDVAFDGKRDEGEWSSNSGAVTLDKGVKLYGDGTIVKQGVGALSLEYDSLTGTCVDGMDLTGLNTGYAWVIEGGLLRASHQTSLGKAGVYIDSGGTLSLTSCNKDQVIISSKAISQIKEGLTTNVFVNNITSGGGGISIASHSNIELKGILDSSENGDLLSFAFYEKSVLLLSSTNSTTASAFSINFGGKYGGAANYLVADVDRLATDLITVKNTTGEDWKDFAFFELVIKEDSDKTYSGSLQGDMYLHKLGSGTVNLTGNNTFSEGTYISEGGLLLATSNALGTGNILFDSDTANSADYASIGVAEGGDIELINNIHVKKGAILDVAEGQNMYLKGDLVRYDARPGYEAEFIKNGLGNAIISKIEGVDRKINISTFTVTEGGFILDKGVASDSYFSLDGQQAFLEVRENAEIKNNAIDIHNGDLIIFDDNCISSATAIVFHSTATSRDSFSKFHIMSDSVLSDETISVSSITVKGNIEFVVGSTTTASADDTASAAVVTAQMDKFKFESGANTVIVKSGDGDFIAEGNGNFSLDSLYVNGGKYRIENTTMTVLGETLLDGGILAISQTSHFASSAAAEEDRKITVLDGSGISIYNGDSIAEGTKLMFIGTDTVNLSKLVIEGENVELKNSIYVDTGLIIENENDFTFKGEYLDGEYGILAKSGAGTMTINSSGTFNMGELRSLEGNLLINSDINVSTISIEGEKAVLSFEGIGGKVNNSTIESYLSLGNDGTLSLSTATVNVAKMELDSAHIIINQSSKLNSSIANFYNSRIDLNDVSSVIGNGTGIINLDGESFVYGYGKLNATVNVGNGSSIHVGADETAGENLSATNVVFESGSELFIDIDDESGATDKLSINGDITVQKNVTLHVNFTGNEEDDNSGSSNINFADNASTQPKKFEILTFAGSYNFANPTSEIFDIILNDARLSANTSLVGNSIFLGIAQKFSSYEIPGATKNQESMVDVLNDIHDDSTAKENMKSVFATLDQLYTSDKAQFLNALQDLSGIFYANSFMTSAMLSKANILYNRLNENSDEIEEKNRVWAQVYTNNFTVSENDENPEFKNSIYGMIAGYDTVQDESLTFGIAGFYGQGELKQLDDKADVVDAGVNIYGDYKVNENIDVKGLIGYSMQDYDTTRKLRYNKQEITSKYATNTISLDLEAAYRYDLGDKLSLKPLVGANCAVVSNGDIEEDGDTEQRLKIKKGSYSRAEVRVGVGLQGISDSPFHWHASAAIKHIISGSKFTTKSCFAEAPGHDFEIESTEVAGTSFSGLLGCSYDITPVINVSLDINADAGAVSQFGGNIGASYRW